MAVTCLVPVGFNAGVMFSSEGVLSDIYTQRHSNEQSEIRGCAFSANVKDIMAFIHHQLC